MGIVLRPESLGGGGTLYRGFLRGWVRFCWGAVNMMLWREHDTALSVDNRIFQLKSLCWMKADCPVVSVFLHYNNHAFVQVMLIN